MASIIDIANFISYTLLFGSSIFVNKYVLSTLNFIYPTVFQGWQTLVGAILLKLILSKNCVGLGGSTTQLDKPGFVSLLPSFLFFSAGIVASSKALAELSVPVYLCLQNTYHAVLHLLEASPTFREDTNPYTVAASLITIASAIAVVLFEINMTFSDSPYFWMLVYIACLSVQSLHSRIADVRYKDIDSLYFCYIFSVIVLAPASLYLEEAFEVLKFPNASRYDFYIGCLLAGIFSLFLNLSVMNVKKLSYFSTVDAFGRLGLSCLSVLVFSDSSSSIARLFICLNFISSILVPIPPQKKCEDVQTESVASLLTQEI